MLMGESEMRRSALSSVLFLWLIVPAALCHAQTAFADDANVQDQLKALKDRVQHLEGVETELIDVKARLEKLESAGCTPAEQETICKRVDEWFANNQETIVQSMSKHALKKEMLGLDIAMGGYATFIYQSALTRPTVGGHHANRRDPLSYTLGLELTAYLTEERDQYIFLLLRAGNGSGIDDLIPNNMVLNNNAEPTNDTPGQPDVAIDQLYYQGNFLDDKFTLTFGKMDFTYFFDSNAVAYSERYQFISGALVNNLLIPFPSTENVAVSALYSPFGAQDPGDEKENSTDWLLLQLGLSQTDENMNSTTSHGLLIGEVTFRPHKLPCLKDRIHNRPGNYRVGGFLNDGHIASLDDLREERETGDSSMSGVYLSFDQEICDNITLFMRYGNQNKDVAPNNQFWSYGIQFLGQMWGREGDVIGLASAVNVHNPRANFMRPEYTANERLYEIYYRWRVSKFLQVSPDLQLLGNPSGNPHARTAVVAGLRLQFDF